MFSLLTNLFRKRKEIGELRSPTEIIKVGRNSSFFVGTAKIKTKFQQTEFGNNDNAYVYGTARIRTTNLFEHSDHLVERIPSIGTIAVDSEHGTLLENFAFLDVSGKSYQFVKYLHRQGSPKLNLDKILEIGDLANTISFSYIKIDLGAGIEYIIKDRVLTLGSYSFANGFDGLMVKEGSNPTIKISPFRGRNSPEAERMMRHLEDDGVRVMFYYSNSGEGRAFRGYFHPESVQRIQFGKAIHQKFRKLLPAKRTEDGRVIVQASNDDSSFALLMMVLGDYISDDNLPLLENFLITSGVTSSIIRERIPIGLNLKVLNEIGVNFVSHEYMDFDLAKMRDLIFKYGPLLIPSAVNRSTSIHHALNIVEMNFILDYINSDLKYMVVRSPYEGISFIVKTDDDNVLMSPFNRGMRTLYYLADYWKYAKMRKFPETFRLLLVPSVRPYVIGGF